MIYLFFNLQWLEHTCSSPSAPVVSHTLNEFDTTALLWSLHSTADGKPTDLRIEHPASLRACILLHRTKPMDHPHFSGLRPKSWGGAANHALLFLLIQMEDLTLSPSIWFFLASPTQSSPAFSFCLTKSGCIQTKEAPVDANSALQNVCFTHTHTHTQFWMPSYWIELALFDQMPLRGKEGERANVGNHFQEPLSVITISSFSNKCNEMEGEGWKAIRRGRETERGDEMKARRDGWIVKKCELVIESQGGGWKGWGERNGGTEEGKEQWHREWTERRKNKSVVTK